MLCEGKGLDRFQPSRGMGDFRERFACRDCRGLVPTMRRVACGVCRNQEMRFGENRLHFAVAVSSGASGQCLLDGRSWERVTPTSSVCSLTLWWWIQ